VHNHLFNFLDGHVLGFGDEEDGEEDGDQADAAEEEEYLQPNKLHIQQGREPYSAVWWQQGLQQPRIRQIVHSTA
jgi:hypothetical protein